MSGLPVVCVCILSKSPLPLQLATLYLGENLLEGTLPEWTYLTNVSPMLQHCCNTVLLMLCVLQGRGQK